MKSHFDYGSGKVTQAQCYIRGMGAKEFLHECPPSPSKVEEHSSQRKVGVRLKRPNLDVEENSPVKRRPAKARRLCENTKGSRTSPRKSNTSSARSSALSPVKSVNSPSKRAPRGTAGSTPLKEMQPTFSTFVPPSPLQKSPVKRLLTNPAFSSLFDTPEKGQTAAWGEISPMKTSVTEQKGTPIRSPRKPVVHKEVLTKNVEFLLLPTPEKRKRNEVLEPFQPEEVAKKKAAGGQKKGMAVAFSAEQGRIIKRAFKRSNAKGAKPTKEKGNYVRINMKKKSYAKGKVSAEQKRKMRRKQNWKKKMAGGSG
ncbi:unnamed protein product [Haemonchus placei]|uniref:Nucleolar GTP-binding protein 2 n=1 Tax=Haemonchus placei TaxID=6290 RepID=A0A0N4W1H7_HAEPC|nr:unnamed protein product [Haemonchus placei]